MYSPLEPNHSILSVLWISANIPDDKLDAAVAFKIGATADVDGTITDLCVLLED